jgi:hypothetical protein
MPPAPTPSSAPNVADAIAVPVLRARALSPFAAADRGAGVLSNTNAGNAQNAIAVPI